MSTDLARQSNGVAVNGAMTAEQVALIKRTIAKDATNDELSLFIMQCNRTGLDPFNRQIWFTKRQGKMSILTGIDGYRLIGERTGRRMGSTKLWCGEDGIWRDVWLSKARPAAAKAIVKVLAPNGTVVEYDGIALWSEYGEKADGFMWPKMPAAQLGKCAEALAYRAAFPAETSGVYVAEEMDQAGPAPERPTARSLMAEQSRTEQANLARPANPETGEVVTTTTRTKRQPPNSAPANKFPPQEEVEAERVRLRGEIADLGEQGIAWLEEMATKRGIADVLITPLGPGDLKVVAALVKTAKTMDNGGGAAPAAEPPMSSATDPSEPF